MPVKFQVPDVATKNALKVVLDNTLANLVSTDASPFPVLTFTKYADAVDPALQSLLETIMPANWRIDISGLSPPDKTSFLSTLGALIVDWNAHAVAPGVTLTEAQLQMLFVVMVRP